MALLDRVKERTETDLSDLELQRMIDEANSAIIMRHGANADAAAPITVRLEGGAPALDLVRPVDTLLAVTVVETVGDTDTTLAASDWRALNGGRTLERLGAGANPRQLWGKTKVTYVPRNDGNERQEVIVKLVQLAVEFEGVALRRVGDTTTDHTSPRAGMVYQEEREKLLRSLSPRPGLLAA